MELYSLLNQIISNKKFELSSSLYVDEDRNLLSEDDKATFDLLKNISSLDKEVSNKGVCFKPLIVRADGYRSFSIEDLTEEDLNTLIGLEFSKLPLELQALVNDLIWELRRDYKAAERAANSYWGLFVLWYKEDDTVGTLDVFRRALCIAIQTKQAGLYTTICSWMEQFLRSEAIYADAFFSLRVMEMFLSQKDYDVSSFLARIEEIIQRNINYAELVEQAYKLKTNCFLLLKRKNEATKSNLDLADYLVSYAKKFVNQNQGSTLYAISLLQKGIQLFRNNGNSQEAERTHKFLVEIQGIIPQTATSTTFEIDISNINKYLKLNLEGMTFEECILWLAQLVSFDRYEDIEKSTIDDLYAHPFLNLFQRNIRNNAGQVIIPLPPLDINDPKKDPALLKLHMCRNLYTNQNITGTLFIRNSLNMIRERYTISSSMLDFLIKGNAIIPDGRERIFQSGVTMFLMGEYYEAMHILAPQMENLFRNIAKEVGCLTVTLESDGSSSEKTLSSIFSLKELDDYYDKNILFTFSELLNERAGANIRNNIAHGIFTEADSSLGSSLYFGAAVIKLLSLYSLPCQNLYLNSDKLKHHKIPNSGAIKIKSCDICQE